MYFVYFKTIKNLDKKAKKIYYYKCKQIKNFFIICINALFKYLNMIQFIYYNYNKKLIIKKPP